MTASLKRGRKVFELSAEEPQRGSPEGESSISLRDGRGFDFISDALPFGRLSHVFLTERSFSELLNRSAIQSVIGPTKCRVVSNVSEALAVVAEILAD